MTFCHNGECPRFTNSENTPLLGKTTPQYRIYHPVGDTDSEAVFCAILNALTAEFSDDELPTLAALHACLSCLCEQIIEGHPEETIFNFLLGAGQYSLFAYSWPGKRPGSKVWNGLHYIIRQPPFSTAKLLDVDYSIDFRNHTTAADRVAVITTKPLTEEPGWTEFQRGELILFDKGLPYRTPKCCEAVEKEGRGLYSKCFFKKCNASPSAIQQSRPPSPPQMEEPLLPPVVATAVPCLSPTTLQLSAQSVLKLHDQQLGHPLQQVAVQQQVAIQ
jgi:predicted glutamine amidotransferase